MCTAGADARHTERKRTYIAIDLKSFYASVECVARGLDPLTTHLVVADERRTDKTICLAVSPSLKAYGIGGRARLFEAKQILRQVNAQRIMRSPNQHFTGSSTDSRMLEQHNEYAADMIIAQPRMAEYLRASTSVYQVYLRYVSAQDIHVYSVDEVFMDVTQYLKLYGGDAHRLATCIIRDILHTTGITATAGIGSNLYLCKVAMDIVAKHIPANADGVRIAELDEYSYRKLLWAHTPITDFWRIGRGMARRLASLGLLTMGDIARCSLGKASDFYNADLLYRTFGVNAELVIDHAWGYESCTISDIKSYKPDRSSISSGQILQHPYDYAHALLVMKEMVDTLALELVEQQSKATNISLYIGYERIDAQHITHAYQSDTDELHHRLAKDYYGRIVPKPAHASVSLESPTSSSRVLLDSMVKLYRGIVDPAYLIRRIHISFNALVPAQYSGVQYEQPDLFTACMSRARRHTYSDNQHNGEQDCSNTHHKQYRSEQSIQDIAPADLPTPIHMHTTQIPREDREYQVSQALLDIQHKFGRNAVVKAMNLDQGATGMMRNQQIGGHAA